MTRNATIKEIARVLRVPVEKISLEGGKRKGFWTFLAWYEEGINGYRFGRGCDKKATDARMQLLYSIHEKQVDIQMAIWRQYLRGTVND